MGIHRLLAAILLLAAALPAAEPPLPALAAVRAHTDREVIARWFPACVEPDGGFHPVFARDWTRKPADTVSLVFTARMVWFAAACVEHRPQRRAEFQTIARRGAAFLDERYWDKANGGLRWEIAADHSPLGGEKHLYGMAFAIYALCAAHRATGDPAPLAAAARAFDWIEAKAHDHRGGWAEALDEQGRPLEAAATGDRIGTRTGYRSMNTHLHLLECLTALAAVDQRALVRQRLAEAAGILTGPLWSEPGCLHMYATPEWKPLADGTSFGHNIEAAFLLAEAAEVLGRDDAAARARQRALVDHTLEFGFDPEDGGLYDAGSAFRPATNRTHVWWAQAEAINGLILMDRRHGAETPRYRQALARLWAFIEARQLDREQGGWLWDSCDEAGRLPAMTDKGGNWMAAYHNGRALFALEGYLAQP